MNIAGQIQELSEAIEAVTRAHRVLAIKATLANANPSGLLPPTEFEHVTRPERDTLGKARKAALAIIPRLAAALPEGDARRWLCELGGGLREREAETVEAVWPKLRAALEAVGTAAPIELDEDSLLPPSRLAELFGVDAERLRKRLEAFRRRSYTGWVEVADPGAHEAQYRYEVGAIRPIIEDLKASTSLPPQKN